MVIFFQYGFSLKNSLTKILALRLGERTYVPLQNPLPFLLTKCVHLFEKQLTCYFNFLEVSSFFLVAAKILSWFGISSQAMPRFRLSHRSFHWTFYRVGSIGRRSSPSQAVTALRRFYRVQEEPVFRVTCLLVSHSTQKNPFGAIFLTVSAWP